MFSVDVSIRVYLSMLPVCTVTMSQLSVLYRCINRGVFVHVTCLYCDYVYISVSHGGLFSVAVKSRCNCYLYFHYNYVRSIFKEVALAWLYLVEDCFLSQ